MEEQQNKEQKLPVSSILIAVVVILVLGLGYYIYKYNQAESYIQANQGEWEQTEAQRMAKDSIMNAMEDVFDEIAYNLTYVQDKQGGLMLVDPSEYNNDPRQQIVDDVKLMDRLLYDSQEKIKALEDELNKTGLNNTAYQRRLESLNRMIEKQNGEIIDLQQVVAVQDFNMEEFREKLIGMNERIEKQNDSIESQLETIHRQEDELNTGYVAYGTMKELKEKGLVNKTGTVLGFGGSKELADDFDQSYFLEVDMRDVKQISLHAKKAELITQHPAGSYSFVENENGIAFLSINDPEEFWKVSRYVVVLVK